MSQPTIGMTGRAAGFLVTVSSVAVGISGILIVTEPSSLGVSGDTLKLVAGWLALAGSITNIMVVALRRNYVPGVQTGIGTEEGQT